VIRAAGLRADSEESLVEIQDFSVIPTLEADPFFRRLEQRADRINLTAGPILLRGLDFHRYFAEDALYVRSIEVNSLDVHVFADINIAWGPRARACRYHNGFAEIEVPMTIDTIQLVDADIRYSELAKGAARPGELTFEDLSGVVVNVTNDREKMTHETPVVVDVTGKLFGEGNVQARLAYPLLSPTLDFSLEASVGPMNMSSQQGISTGAGQRAHRHAVPGLLLPNLRQKQRQGDALALSRRAPRKPGRQVEQSR
jgi:hypothetical protein